MFVTECSGVHCDMLTWLAAAAVGGQDTGGGQRWGLGALRGISLTVFVSEVQEMKNINEKGEKEKEYKEHLSLEAAVAAISDEKIIYLCKCVISGRG